MLGHVAIEILERSYVGRISAVRSAQLIVLRPQVALYDFGPGREPKKIRITFGKATTALRICFAFGHQQCTGWQQRCADNAQAPDEGASPDVTMIARFKPLQFLGRDVCLS